MASRRRDVFAREPAAAATSWTFANVAALEPVALATTSATSPACLLSRFLRESFFFPRPPDF